MSRTEASPDPAHRWASELCRLMKRRVPACTQAVLSSETGQGVQHLLLGGLAAIVRLLLRCRLRAALGLGELRAGRPRLLPGVCAANNAPLPNQTLPKFMSLSCQIVSISPATWYEASFYESGGGALSMANSAPASAAAAAALFFCLRSFLPCCCCC